jgi:hypothetical protein
MKSGRAIYLFCIIDRKLCDQYITLSFRFGYNNAFDIVRQVFSSLIHLFFIFFPWMIAQFYLNFNVHNFINQQLNWSSGVPC